MGGAIWTAVTIAAFPNILGSSSGIFVAVYLMISVGSVMFLGAFFGCLTAYMNNKWMLATVRWDGKILMQIFIEFFVYLRRTMSGENILKQLVSYLPCIYYCNISFNFLTFQIFDIIFVTWCFYTEFWFYAMLKTVTFTGVTFLLLWLISLKKDV